MKILDLVENAIHQKAKQKTLLLGLPVITLQCVALAFFIGLIWPIIILCFGKTQLY